MTERQCNTAVAFLIFNRPETTARVFTEIAKVKPPKLLVIADGPRAKKTGESERCTATRAIIERVDWPCEVLTNYAVENLGCKRRVSSGLDWVFDTVEEAIILEDDCVPHPTFFRFCEELLAKYRDDERIMQISGDNFQFGHHPIANSYYFSRYSHIWGWATWRRAWRKYDVNATKWGEVRNTTWLRRTLDDIGAARRWAERFDSAYRGEIDTWDYQWTFAVWLADALTILPRENLISNIGFGTGATHTRLRNRLANLPTKPMSFPLRHPDLVERDQLADARTERTMARLALPARVLGTASKLAARALSPLRRSAGPTDQRPETSVTADGD